MSRSAVRGEQVGTGIFDIIGPVMVGPSSSHTAGAARIGAVAGQVSGSVPARVDFYLHGSFAETYRGHGTDQALAGGILGLSPDDQDLSGALDNARLAGMELHFHPADLGDVHPNTVKIVMRAADGSEQEVVGSSVGGGAIIIHSVNRVELEFSAEHPTLLTLHEDKPGLIAAVTGLLADYQINIAFLKLLRQIRGLEASMVIEADNRLPLALVDAVRNLPGIQKVHYICISGEKTGGYCDVPLH